MPTSTAPEEVIRVARGMGIDVCHLASILRRSGWIPTQERKRDGWVEGKRRSWRPTKTEQALIDASPSNGGPPPIVEFCSTSGWSVLDPHGKRAHSVAGGDPNLDLGLAENGGKRCTCEACGRPFKAKRSTARYCGPTCRSRAHRGHVA